MDTLLDPFGPRHGRRGSYVTCRIMTGYTIDSCHGSIANRRAAVANEIVPARGAYINRLSLMVRSFGGDVAARHLASTQ